MTRRRRTPAARQHSTPPPATDLPAPASNICNRMLAHVLSAFIHMVSDVVRASTDAPPPPRVAFCTTRANRTIDLRPGALSTPAE